MKNPLNFCIAIIAVAAIFCNSTQAQTRRNTAALPDFRNFYGICWRGSPHENLVYARQMGYQCVFYQYGMESDPLSNGMYFYLETPEYLLYDRKIDSKKTYTQSQIDFYENYCALKDTTASFPNNLATGWMWDVNSGIFTPLLDFRQQRVINFAVDGIMKVVKRIETKNPNFRCAGFAWDEPRANGDFWENRNGKRMAASMERWTRNKFQSMQLKRSYDFSSYTDGHLVFYKQLYQAARSEHPNVHFISEPYDIYRDWLAAIKDRPDAKEINQDILSQEGPGTQFIDDKRIFATSLINRENLYCTTPNEFTEKANRIIAAKAAVNGENFGWFGRFGGTGDMPDFKSITEVPPRLKLIRMLTNWENLNGTPVAQRSWDGATYQSNTAYVSPDVIAIIQPNTNKLFIVFLTANGSYTLPGNKKAIGVSQTNNLFVEDGNGTADIGITQNVIKPKGNDALNKGYIINLGN